MQLRASALVRRFRHRAPTESAALLKTIRSKNGNMRLRIMAKSGRTSPGELQHPGSAPHQVGLLQAAPR